MTLPAIAAVILGGTALTGGKGNVLKTLPGVLIVLAIQSGFNVVQLDPYWQRIAFGVFGFIRCLYQYRPNWEKYNY